MSFHQKREIQIYIRQNYTTLHKPFLTFKISSKSYNSYPKIFTKTTATVAFGRKVSEGYRFKKDSIHTFLLPCDVVVVLLHKLLSFIRWYCYIEFLDIGILKCYYYR